MSSQLLFSLKSGPGDSLMCLNLVAKRLFCTWVRGRGDPIPSVRSLGLSSANGVTRDLMLLTHLPSVFFILGSSFQSSKTLSSKALESQ